MWLRQPGDPRNHAMTVEKTEMIPGTNEMRYVLKDSDGNPYNQGAWISPERLRKR